MSDSFSRPEAGFAQLPLRPSIQKGLAALGFVEPRPIQAQTIPDALQGRDVLGLAQTGTGKTAAFVLPILERLLAAKGPGPRALIIAPTRELALQIHAEFESLAKFTGVRAVAIFGGVSMERQIRALRRRPEVLIACPGRLLDLMGQGRVQLDAVETFVLDEADHMFDMGFIPAIRRVVAALPKKRQNLMFSATMPAEIRKLADGLLRRPVVVELAHSAPAETVEHALYPVAGENKLELLRHLLTAGEIRSAIVFSRTKHRAKRLATQLTTAGLRATSLQGNMTQGQRDRAMQGFRDGRYDILVATDIAARGIDVARVSHVINFDIPDTPDAYTHRIGRTGRAERSGTAYTFVTPEDRAVVRAIERQLGAAIARRQAPGFAPRAATPRSQPAGNGASASRPRPRRTPAGAGDRPQRRSGKRA